MIRVSNDTTNKTPSSTEGTFASFLQTRSQRRDANLVPDVSSIQPERSSLTTSHWHMGQGRRRSVVWPRYSTAFFWQLAPWLQSTEGSRYGTTCLGMLVHLLKTLFPSEEWVWAKPESAIITSCYRFMIKVGRSGFDIVVLSKTAQRPYKCYQSGFTSFERLLVRIIFASTIVCTRSLSGTMFMRQLRLADGWASRSCVPLSRLIRLPSRRLEPGAAMVHLGKRVKGEHIPPVVRFDERRHSSHLFRPGEDSRPV
jgi:hypothetical protein